MLEPLSSLGQIDGVAQENRDPGLVHYRSIFGQAATVADFDKSLTQVMNALRLGEVGEGMLVWEAAQRRRVARMKD